MELVRTQRDSSLQPIHESHALRATLRAASVRETWREILGSSEVGYAAMIDRWLLESYAHGD